jgi:hypothetical protein
MKTGNTFLTALFALATFPVVAQQPAPTAPPGSPATQQPPATAQPPATTQPDTPAAPPATPAVEMSPVKGELVSKLDSKTAKTGDDVVVQTKSSAKTADGTEIPKGSKLMGHIVAVQASGAGANSQVALQFDHIVMKGGQSMAVQSQIQSIAPPEGEAPMDSSPAMTGGAINGPPAGASPSMGGANSKTNSAPQVPGSTPGLGSAPAANNLPAAGTVVATSGQIAIRTTSVPGVLLANNVAGQQDPRMAQASSILVGARKDIQLDGGTQLVVGVTAAGGGGTR